MAEKTQVDVSVWPKVEERIVELSEKLEKLMGDHAPEAWSLVLDAIRFSAIAELVLGLVLLGLTVWVGRLCFSLGRKAAKASFSDEGPYIFGSVATGFLTVGGCIGVAFTLLNTSNWIGAFAPEIIFARQVLAGVL